MSFQDSAQRQFQSLAELRAHYAQIAKRLRGITPASVRLAPITPARPENFFDHYHGSNGAAFGYVKPPKPRAPVVKPKAAEPPAPEPVKLATEKLTAILNAASKVTGVTSDAIVSRTRKKDVMAARHLFLYVARQRSKLSMARIGRLFSGRDHSTLINSIARVESRMDRYAHLIERVNSILDGEQHG